MARKRSRSKRAGKSIPAAAPVKLRTCGQCQTAIEGGTDMYRLHSTGVTVCKVCWITMDPLNNNRNNKRRRQSQAEVKNTRLCAVFLKDVLTDPPSQKEKKGSPKVDKNPEEAIVISDSSEEDDEPLSETLKSIRTRRSSRVQSSEKEPNSNLRSKRGLKSEESDGGSKKKLKTTKTETPSGLRRSARYQSSDSDNVRGKGKAEKPDEDNSRNKLGVKEPKKNGGGGKARVVSKGDDSSSSNGDVGRSSGKVRNQVPLIIKPESVPKIWKAQKNVKEEEPRSRPVLRNRRAVQKKSIIKSIDKIEPPSKSKRNNSLKRAKTLMTVRFPFKIRNHYECKVCGTDYRNKIIGMKHELTHYNQVEIKIQKLNVNHHFQNNDQNSRTTIDIHDDTCSINEKSTTTLHEEPDSGKEEEESLCPTDEPESVHREDKSQDAKVPEDTSSTNGLPTEESTSPPDDSKRETADNVSPDSEAEKKIPDPAEEVVEKNTIDSNGRAEEEIKAVKETDKEADETVEGEKDPEDNVTLPSSAEKNADGEKESGEEMESDTDIRIVDTGSSGEDSNQRSEKVADDVSAPKETEDSVQVEDKSEDEKASKIDSVDAEAESLNNGEPGREEQVEGEVTPISAVTEILQEVMDLATAEVQKRFDSGVASLPETLENISDEINKTVDETPAVEKTGVDEEADSAELDSNSVTNTLENYIELSSTEV